MMFLFHLQQSYDKIKLLQIFWKIRKITHNPIDHSLLAFFLISSLFLYPLYILYGCTHTIKICMLTCYITCHHKHLICYYIAFIKATLRQKCTWMFHNLPTLTICTSWIVPFFANYHNTAKSSLEDFPYSNWREASYLVINIAFLVTEYRVELHKTFLCLPLAALFQ